MMASGEMIEKGKNLVERFMEKARMGRNLGTNIILGNTNLGFHNKWKYWGLFGSSLNIYYTIQLPLEEEETISRAQTTIKNQVKGLSHSLVKEEASKSIQPHHK
jgi:hypothetical protein